MNLSRQFTLGYALMFFLMVFISGFSVYNIYRLDKATSNIKGRYNTLSSLLSSKEKEIGIQQNGNFATGMLDDAIKISDEQVGYAYINTFIVVGIALLFSGILTFICPRVITKPVFLLVDAIKGIVSGDYSYRIKNLRGSSEISILIQVFNNMLENIERHQKELESKNTENLKLVEETRKFNETLKAKIEEATREIKEKQEELIKSERLATIGELTAGIAHEIRNPLSGIAIALTLMKKEIQDPEHGQTISDILKEIDRLGRIIKELLQFAQLSYPQSLNLIECDPNEIVERALSLTRLRAEQKGISIEKRLNCIERFKVDPEQIQQVVINLLINGIEAMNGPGKLTVETESSAGYVVIKVSDTGLGFPEEDKEKIFRPFYSTKEHGTGLGLSISHRIVEIHKGKIVAWSEKEKGSAFTVMIPTSSS